MSAAGGVRSVTAPAMWTGRRLDPEGYAVAVKRSALGGDLVAVEAVGPDGSTEFWLVSKGADAAGVVVVDAPHEGLGRLPLGWRDRVSGRCEALTRSRRRCTRAAELGGVGLCFQHAELAAAGCQVWRASEVGQ